MTLGARIRTAREAAKLTQQQLADRVGVSRAAVGLWESGTHAPHRSKAVLLAQILSISVSEIDPLAASSLTEIDNTVTQVKVVLATWEDFTRTDSEMTNATVVYGDVGQSRDVRGLIVRDDSMAPTYRVGDTIIVDRSALPAPGDDVIAEVAGTRVLRRYHLRGLDSKGHPAFDLLAENPDFPTLSVNSNHPGRVLGVVIEHRRKLRR